MTGALVPHSTMEARCLLLLAFTEWWGAALDARIIIGLPAIVKSTPLPRCLLTIISSYCGDRREGWNVRARGTILLGRWRARIDAATP